MLRTFSNDLAVGLKDQLRELRYLIRSNRHDAARSVSPAGAEPGPEFLLQHAASAIDEALTTAQTITESLTGRGLPKGQGQSPVQSLTIYFQQSGMGLRAFRRDLYAALKQNLQQLGAENILIHESGFVAIHDNMLRRHRALLDSVAVPPDDEARIAAAAQLVSLLFEEMRQQLQLRFSHTARSSNYGTQGLVEATALAAVCLALGLATAKPDEVADLDLSASAMLVLDAWKPRFTDVLQSADPARLEQFFELLIQHLP